MTTSSNDERKTYEVVWANYRDGRSSEEMVYRWSKRWLAAEKQLGEKPAERVAACDAHLARMLEMERRRGPRFPHGAPE